jgi:FkbM family methyltransferase
MLQSVFVGMLAPPACIQPVPGWRLGQGQYERVLPLRLRRFLWRRVHSQVVMPWSRGLRVHLYPGDEISRALFLTGAFEPTQMAFLAATVKEGMTFLDVGANFGLYTLLASRLVGKSGRVIAVEPSSREFAHLSGNVALNGLTNVSLLNCAATDRSGEAELILAGTAQSGHNTLGAFGYPSVSSAGNERVRTTTMDSMVAESGVSRIDCIKMDIEGAELLALRGSTGILEKFRPTILLELSDRTLRGQNCSSGDVLEFFQEHDYAVFDFDDATGGLVAAPHKSDRDGDNVVAIHSGNLEAFRSWIGSSADEVRSGVAVP